MALTERLGALQMENEALHAEVEELTVEARRAEKQSITSKLYIINTQTRKGGVPRHPFGRRGADSL